MATELRIPPQNIDAEKALLGSAMLRTDTLSEVLDILPPEAFYVEKHRLIWKVMLELFGKNAPIDLLSLSSRLKEKELLESVGGASYIAELAGVVPSAANARHYAELIAKKHLMRSLISAAEHIEGLGYDEEQEVDAALDAAEKKVLEIGKRGGTHSFLELKDTLAEAWERLDRLHKTGEGLRGIPTGFKEIDAKLSGLQKSDLIILAARPSMGKTSLALDIARQTATLHGTKVAVFSLEMSSQQLVDRMLAAESRVDAWRLRTGKLTTEDEFAKIRDSLDRLSKAPIYIDDQPSANILKIRSVARRIRHEKGLDLIIVDYLQLMTPTNTRIDSVVQQVSEISRSLKHLARELEVPVLTLSQLNRNVETRGGKPRLSDLRDSGSIEQDADVVMFIHREDKYKAESDKPNIAEILIEKHRNGPTGKVELYFDADKATFLSLEKGSMSEF